MGRIVWLASYPKSGNTWLRSLLANYLAAPDAPLPINELWRYATDDSKPGWYLPYTKGRSPGSLPVEEIAALRPRVQQDIAASASGIVLVKTHSVFGQLEGCPLQEESLTAGAIYILRNPLDLVPSIAAHFGLDRDAAVEFLNNEATGMPGDEANVSAVLCDWSTHVRSWRPEPPKRNFLLLRYEDLHTDTAGVLGSVLRYLGIAGEKGRIDRAVAFSRFEQLREQEERQGFIERSPRAARFFRRGEVGGWRSELSAGQAERVIHAHRLEMQRHGYLPA